MIKDLRIKNGFTLVELLVAISILIIMVGIVIGTLNPIALVNKARDSRRKNDINKIKIALEAYNTDKGTYPTEVEVAVWNIGANCGKPITQMKSYLKILPCDPNKKPYEIMIISSSFDPYKPTVPKGFKVITNLENKTDVNIPSGWYTDDLYNFRDRKDEVNYGVSSSNLLWYDYSGISRDCGLNCYSSTYGTGSCVKSNYCVSGGSTLCFMGSCSGNNMGTIFPGIQKTPQCYVDRCCFGSGCE